MLLLFTERLLKLHFLMSFQHKYFCSVNYGKMSLEGIRFQEEILKQVTCCITLKFY